MIETRDPKAVSRSIASLVHGIVAIGRAGVINISEDLVLSSFGEDIARIQGATILIAHLQAHLPKSAFPVVLVMDHAGVPSVTMGGLAVRSTAETDLSTALRDLEVIDRLRRDLPSGEDTPYALKRRGAAGSGEAIPAIWARSPVEAMIKHAASLRPGLHRDPVSTLQVDPHLEGRLEMRGLHDWRLHDVDAAMAEARAAIDRAFPEPDDGPDGP